MDYRYIFTVKPQKKLKNKTLQNIFDLCQLSKESQAILCADSGDLGAPPERLSVLAYTSLFSGYNAGTYYLIKYFSYFRDRLDKYITGKPNCNILYNAEVTGIKADKKAIY